MEQRSSQGSDSTDTRHAPAYGLRDTAYQRSMAERTAQSEAAFFLPHLQTGMSILDCGCGPGSVTIDLARLVAPGHVIGIDISTSDIVRAKALAVERGATNVKFEIDNVYALPFADHTFDAVFSNALLEHLGEPVDALREMRRVLKPGGVAGIRAADRDGYLIAPPDPLLGKYGEMAERLKATNATAYIGKHLRALLRQAGFVRVQASASYDSYGTPEQIRKLGEALAAGVTMAGRADKLIKAGWTNQEELEQIAAAFRRWAEDPDAFFAQARCEAVGWTE